MNKDRETIYKLAVAAKQAVEKIMDEFDCWDDERIIREIKDKAMQLEQANAVDGIRSFEYRYAIKCVFVLGAWPYYETDDKRFVYLDWLDAIREYDFNMPGTAEVMDTFESTFFGIERAVVENE